MTDQATIDTLVQSVQELSAAFTQALETRDAPNALKFAGLTLAQFQAMFGEDTVTELAQLTSDFIAFVARRDNPHLVTASQVGLGLVQNFAPATPSEAALGLASNKYMTPALSKAAFDQRWQEKLGGAPADLNTIEEIAFAIVTNRTNIATVEAVALAAETPVGAQSKVDALNTAIQGQLATKLNATAQATDSAKLSGFTLSEVISQAAASVNLSGKLDINAQAYDSLRFNGKTQAQITATQAEVDGGVVSTKFVTPQTAKVLVDQTVGGVNDRVDVLSMDMNNNSIAIMELQAADNEILTTLASVFDAIGTS